MHVRLFPGGASLRTESGRLFAFDLKADRSGRIHATLRPRNRSDATDSVTLRQRFASIVEAAASVASPRDVLSA